MYLISFFFPQRLRCMWGMVPRRLHQCIRKRGEAHKAILLPELQRSGPIVADGVPCGASGGGWRDGWRAKGKENGKRVEIAWKGQIARQRPQKGEKRTNRQVKGSMRTMFGLYISELWRMFGVPKPSTGSKASLRAPYLLTFSGEKVQNLNITHKTSPSFIDAGNIHQSRSRRRSSMSRTNLLHDGSSSVEILFGRVWPENGHQSHIPSTAATNPGMEFIAMQRRRTKHQAIGSESSKAGHRTSDIGWIG